MKIEDEKRLICESVQSSAEHYNVMIWTIFSVGVGLSLFILYTVWPLKNNLGFMHLVTSFVGLLVLFYCSLTVESFGQKKALMYKILGKEINKIDFKESIKSLSFKRINWIAEIILSGIFLSYTTLFFFAYSNNVYIAPDFNFIFKLLTFVFYNLSIAFFVLVLLNWIRRPKFKNIKIFEKNL